MFLDCGKKRGSERGCTAVSFKGPMSRHNRDEMTRVTSNVAEREVGGDGDENKTKQKKKNELIVVLIQK